MLSIPFRMEVSDISLVRLAFRSTGILGSTFLLPEPDASRTAAVSTTAAPAASKIFPFFETAISYLMSLDFLPNSMMNRAVPSIPRREESMHRS